MTPNFCKKYLPLIFQAFFHIQIFNDFHLKNSDRVKESYSEENEFSFN